MSLALGGLADLCRLPRHCLPFAVAPKKRACISVASCLHLSVAVLRATLQTEGYNHCVAVLVNRNILSQ